MIQAILFDMDGVLTDTEPVINAAARAGLKEYGVDAKPEDFLPFVGTGEDRYIGGVAELHGVHYVVDMKHRVYQIYLELLPKMIVPIPGVVELLEALRRRGLPMAVATSADRIKMEANLAAIEVPLDWFAALVVGEEVANKKPAPDLYQMAARRLRVPPTDCCVVEDAINGVQAAKAAGARCVAVESSFPAARLLAAGADLVRPNMAAISLADLLG